MRARASTSIRARVLALVMTAVGVLWAAAAVSTWINARHELDELLDAHLAQSAALLVAQQLPEMDDEHGIDAPVLHRYAPRVAFQVFHDGRLAVRSVNAPAAPFVDPREADSGKFRSVPIGGDSWRVFATRGSHSDVLVLVAEKMDARSSILAAILRSTLEPVLIALPLLALALWWSVRRGLSPLDAIGRALAARSADDFTPVERSGAPSEMKPMLDALDSLFARIATLLETERRFTADAAHELRTPLAAIRAQAQVALSEPDTALRQRALAATIEGCDRATRLAEQLLALSRLDAQSPSPHAIVDLDALVRGVVADLAPAALAKEQDLRFETAGADCSVRGDAALLAALVRNVVDNAIRYAPDAAKIVVNLESAQGEVRLMVENSGAVPSPAELARLGERFYRVLGNDAPGSGLGLSIVRRIVQLHGGEIAFSQSSLLGGLRVTARFPQQGGSAEHAGRSHG